MKRSARLFIARTLIRVPAISGDPESSSPDDPAASTPGSRSAGLPEVFRAVSTCVTGCMARSAALTVNDAFLAHGGSVQGIAWVERRQERGGRADDEEQHGELHVAPMAKTLEVIGKKTQFPHWQI